MGSTGYTCIRRTFCFFNILIWLCGSGFLAIGVWLHFAYPGYATLLPDQAALSADCLFIAVGVISFVIAFFGCCGSWFQSRCFLVIYFTLVVLLFLSEFLLGSLSFVFRGGIGRMLTQELKYGIEKHYNVSDRGGLLTPSVGSIWDKLQVDLQCCGVSSYEDWYDISAWPGERWVPASCCRTQYGSIFAEGSGDELSNVDCQKAGNPALLWDKSCGQILQMWFVQRLHVVGTVGLVIGFLQLFGLITSMLLFCTVKHKRSSKTYKSYSPTVDTTLNRNGTSGTYMDD
ncbi:tetraspanin-9 [Anopheles nili]|uniref:tetraspanin-9 n=1 Tax=Anopheles nili TaxID=185578 RepID=UPI00237A514E|nr:tetraspanin-9 [Anopheles nili]